MENSNKREDLDKVKAAVLENLSKLPPVPSVPIAVAPPSVKVRSPVAPARLDPAGSVCVSSAALWQPVRLVPPPASCACTGVVRCSPVRPPIPCSLQHLVAHSLPTDRKHFRCIPHSCVALLRPCVLSVIINTSLVAHTDTYCSMCAMCHHQNTPRVPFRHEIKPHQVGDLPEEEMDVRGGGQAYADARVARGDASDDEEEGAARRSFKQELRFTGASGGAPGTTPQPPPPQQQQQQLGSSPAPAGVKRELGAPSGTPPPGAAAAGGGAAWRGAPAAAGVKAEEGANGATAMQVEQGGISLEADEQLDPVDGEGEAKAMTGYVFSPAGAALTSAPAAPAAAAPAAPAPPPPAAAAAAAPVAPPAPAAEASGQPAAPAAPAPPPPPAAAAAAAAAAPPAQPAAPAAAAGGAPQQPRGPTPGRVPTPPPAQ
jgi:hypothetical protein